MNLPPKIRSDYHHLRFNSFNEGDPFSPYRRWVKPSVWIIVGFMIGLLCTNIMASKQEQQIAFNESLPLMGYQANISAVEQDGVLPSANA